MIEQTINEWLSEFSQIDPDGYHSHSVKITQNVDLVSALYSYLDDVNKFQKVRKSITFCLLTLRTAESITKKYFVLQVICMVKVCDVLFKYYRSSVPELRQFTLQLLPQILYTYLNAVAHSDKKVR